MDSKRWRYVLAGGVAVHLAIGYSLTVVLWEQARHRRAAAATAHD